MAYGDMTTAHRYEYNENVKLAFQQKKSRLGQAFSMQPNLKGKLAQAIELIGATEAVEGGGRGEDSPHIEPRTEPVFIQPLQREWGILLEREDDIKRIISYQSIHVQGGAAAFVRAFDRIRAAALFGPRRVGQDGLTIEAYNNPNGTVPVNYQQGGGGSNSGLTLQKIIRAMALLSLNEDMEDDEIYMAISVQQMENLFNLLQFQSSDFRRENKAVLDDKERTVHSFMGCNFIRVPNSFLPITALVRQCAMWMKTGMHEAPFMDLETNIGPNPNKKFRQQIYMEAYFGSTRSEDSRVVSVFCLES